MMLVVPNNPQLHAKRLSSLQRRCMQEIRLLNNTLSEFHQQAARHPLQQRLQELQQRYQFYQTQLTSLTTCALA